MLAALPREPPAQGQQVGYRSALLFGEWAQPLFRQCSRSSPAADGFWDPRAQDIARPEASLPAFLKASPDLAPLTIYHRQYAGFTRGAKKMLYLNAFMDAGGDWTQEADRSCDGGSSYFGAVYDVAGGSWGELHLNGSPP